MRSFVAMCILFLAAAAVFLALLALPRTAARTLLESHGPIEDATAFLYLVAAVTAVWSETKRRRPDYRGALILVGLGLTELGFWEWCLSWHGDGGLLPARIGGTIGLVVVLILALFYVRGHRREFWRAWRGARMDAALVFAGGVGLAIAQVMDVIGKSIPDHRLVGFPFTLGMAEESLELLAPVLFSVALWRRRVEKDPR